MNRRSFLKSIASVVASVVVTKAGVDLLKEEDGAFSVASGDVSLGDIVYPDNFPTRGSIYRIEITQTDGDVYWYKNGEKWEERSH